MSYFLPMVAFCIEGRWATPKKRVLFELEREWKDHSASA
jgi:hypothetical protein